MTITSTYLLYMIIGWKFKLLEMEEKLFHHYCGAGRRGWSNVTRTFQQPKMKNLNIKLSSLTRGQFWIATIYIDNSIHLPFRWTCCSQRNIFCRIRLLVNEWKIGNFYFYFPCVIIHDVFRRVCNIWTRDSWYLICKFMVWDIGWNLF